MAQVAEDAHRLRVADIPIVNQPALLLLQALAGVDLVAAESVDSGSAANCAWVRPSGSCASGREITLAMKASRLESLNE